MRPNKSYKKRDNPHKFPKNKTFSYRSVRRVSDSSDYPNGESKQSQSLDKKTNKLSKFLNIVILLSVFSSLAYLSYLNIDPVVKLDQKAIPRNEADYYKAVQDEINSSVFYQNKLTFNSEKFSENIKERFPEIESIIVEIPVFRHRSTVNISVSEPSARLVTTNKSYILDRQGRALFAEEQINDKFDTSSLVSINDASGHPVTLGKPVLTEQQINYIREVINQSKASNISAQAFNLEFGGSAVDIRFKDASYIVKFSFYEDPKQSSGAYFALREEINNGNAPTPKQYIDLRIPDRAYIK